MNNFTTKILFLVLLVFPLWFQGLCQTYTFTNATATGISGPTQAQITAAYTGTPLAGAVTSTAGIQTWTVPTSGLYKIEATGAKGYGPFAGRGAYMSGYFTLTAGTQLKILVGQQGGCCVSSGTNQYGGGGGTFVTTNTNTPLIIAGGGGGANGNSSILPNSDASITTNGNAGNGTSSGVGGTNGNGGAGISSAGGGGGLLTDGGALGGDPGGFAFVNGGEGGTAVGTSGGWGGFGGGGGADSWDNRRGGGGGGYSGGGGAGSSTGGQEVGGGGGSFNSGVGQVNTAGAGTGHGLVVITAVPPIANNTGASAITSPNATICPGIENVVISVTNFGSNSIDSVRVFWEVNGIAQGSNWHQVNLSPITSGSNFQTNVTLGNFNFPQGTHTVKAWTSLPNNQPDSDNTNDTTEITVTTLMGGSYTINSANPTSGTNFTNFTDFANAINSSGICAPVVVNVAAGSGPYNETVGFGNILGSSAINTIRINGNGAIVQFNNTTSARQLLTLDGTKYMRIDSLVFKSLNTTYGWGARITGGAAHDSITRCQFDMSSVTSTTAANINGIIFSASTTSATSAGINGTNVYIANNHIKGSGAAGGLNYGIGIASGGSDSNIIKNNLIENFYNNGIYIASAKFTLVEGNEIHKANKTSGIVAGEGIYTASGDMSGSKIIGNRIHSPGGTVGSTTVFRGLSLLGDGTAANPVIVANNVIYKFNQGGASSGIYVSTGTYNLIYHNTISFDQVMSGTTANYGIYTTGTNTGTNIVNNLVSITAGTAGIKYGFYHATANGINDAQKNNYYLNSTQSGVQNYGYYTTTYATQAAFQTAYPTLEIGSPTADPQFTAPATGNFLPANPAIQNAGNNLLAIVPADINGIPRATLPTIGAYESLPTNINDASAMTLLSPGGMFCSGSRPVEVVIRNAGANNINTVQVNWSVNGIVQTPLAYSSLLVPSTAPTGQNMDTVLLGNANIIAGANTINVWTSLPNGVTDTDISNDSVNTSLSTTNFAVSAFSDTVCANASVNINLSPASGYVNETITWESSADGLSWATVPGANTPVLSLTGLSATTYFRAKVTNAGITCTTASQEITVITPAITASTPAERCGPGSLTLSATPSGGDVNWYSAATGGAPLHTGTSFTTPNITTTTTYYAAATTSGGNGGYVGKTTISPSPTSGSGTTNFGLVFDVLAPCILDSVTIFPVSTSGASGTVIIDVVNAAGTILHSNTVSVVGSPTSNPTPQRVPLGFNLVPGTNLKLRPRSFTGISGLLFDPSANAPAGNYGYPFVLPGMISINHSTLTAPPTNTARLDLYYYFYNWSVRGGGCESVRVPVVATINEIPQVDLGNDTVICPSATLTLDATAPASGLSYLWNTGATTPTINVSTTGTYSVSVANSNCTGYDTIIVGNAPVPAPVLPDSSAICEGTMLTLDAGNNGSTYLWNDGSSNQTLDVTTAGLYTVNITNPQNCSIQDSTFVTVHAIPVVDLGNDTTICIGAGLVLDAQNNGADYLWNTGNLTQSITIDEEGSYSVTVTNAQQCSASDTIEVSTYEAAAVNGFHFTPRFDLEPGRVDFVPIDPMFVNSYHWDFGDGNTSVTQDPSHIYTNSGNYLVTLTVTNDCGSKDTSLLINVDLFVGVKDTRATDLSIDVFPVPATDYIKIESKDAGLSLQSATVINTIGQIIPVAYNKNNQYLYLDLKQVAAGNYVIIIETSKGKTYRRFNIVK